MGAANTLSGGGEMRVSWPRDGQIPNSKIWEWIPTLPFRDLQITSERNYLSKSIKHSMICNSQCSGLAHSHYPPPPKWNLKRMLKWLWFSWISLPSSTDFEAPRALRLSDDRIKTVCREGNKGFCVVGRIFFLLLPNCSALPCLGPA